MPHSIAYMYMTMVILLNYHNQIVRRVPFYFLLTRKEKEDVFIQIDWLTWYVGLFEI